MPVHDWTKVFPGLFHDFHGDWIQVIKHALNGGLLPPDFYALSEQVAVGVVPDVLTLDAGDRRAGPPGPGGVVATAPRTRYATELRLRVKRRKNRVAVRHAADDRVVAIVEVVSPGNKASRHALQAFVGKAVDLLAHGVHLLVIDLHPPTKRDPQGIPGLVEDEFGDRRFELPADQPLTLSAFEASRPPRAFVEPVAVDDALPDMPLFLVPGGHILLPLEKTYQTAWEGVPARWRTVMETPAAPAG
ncbi:MAG: DUF4058 family protein [Gemmataceae bacterium]|nr:DUF4058 family protein [Gemmataceae bacterium]